MARYKLLDLVNHLTSPKNESIFRKIKITLFLAKIVKFLRGKPPELAGNSKIVIDRITLGGIVNHTEDNDWPPLGLKVPPWGWFTLGVVQAMSRGGIKNNWRESKTKVEISTRFVISAWLHTLPWWLVAIPHRGICLATPSFESTSPRWFLPSGTYRQCLGEE